MSCPGALTPSDLAALDEGDETVVDISLADAPDVQDFGAAIGLAILLAAAVDEALGREA